MSDVDWDAGTENAYDAHRARIESLGLCVRCTENAALPENDLCHDCELEVEFALADVETANA